jgi:hypothetical protein
MCVKWIQQLYSPPPSEANVRSSVSKLCTSLPSFLAVAVQVACEEQTLRNRISHCRFKG